MRAPSGLMPGVGGATVKGFRTGTHRLVAPEATIERVRRFLPVMGITRVANVTGLDIIDIPVVMVCRPNSRSLSVSQGKGLDLAAAKASGLMESIELYHAEQITRPLKLGSYEQLRYTHRLVDVALLCRGADSRFHADLPLLWIEGHDLLQDAPVWVPFETVTTDYTLPRPAATDCFAVTSNGLASGNHLLEAVSHGLCEVIERDSTCLWSARTDDALDQSRVDLATVDDPGCREALAKFERAGVEVRVFETTGDIGLPAYLCHIRDGDGERLRSFPSGRGMGCHPTRGVALLRALTEAAQSRLTVIAGSRDDIQRADYRPPVDDALDKIGADRPAARRFQDAPTFESATFDEDVAYQLERLRTVGVRQVVAIDLTRPEFRLPVVRIVVPGLEGPAEHIPSYVPGPRARALAGARS